jgi:hypothetical protein
LTRDRLAPAIGFYKFSDIGIREPVTRSLFSAPDIDEAKASIFDQFLYVIGRGAKPIGGLFEIEQLHQRTLTTSVARCWRATARALVQRPMALRISRTF